MNQSTSWGPAGAISATRTAALIGTFDTGPAYVGLADALTLVIGDGRISYGTRLPSERELSTALAVSRTTITRAYALLCESGYAQARQGSGTFTRVPGGRARSRDRALFPRDHDHDTIDLNCAAASAPPAVAAAYADAVSDLPAHLGGHGYFPAGLPELQVAIAAGYDARGLPTDPGQIMVTAGALAAAAIVATAFTGPGDRVLVETPAYPNSTLAIRHSGARLSGSPVDPDGWDLGAVGTSLQHARARLAFLIPDFQNPTGHLMSEEQRAAYAEHLRRTDTVAVVDEAHVALALDGQQMPKPFASFAPDTISLGSASKTFWGGLRLGWIRAPRDRVDRLVETRVGLDLGAPVLEQLVLARLLTGSQAGAAAHRGRLREQRDSLAAAVTDQLPEWRFRLPSGGLALWCELPDARATALTIEAERQGVIVAAGPAFAVEGGLDRFVRIPWTRSADELDEAVRRLASAWQVVREAPARTPATRRTGRRVMVA